MFIITQFISMHPSNSSHTASENKVLVWKIQQPQWGKVIILIMINYRKRCKFAIIFRNCFQKYNVKLPIILDNACYCDSVYRKSMTQEEAIQFIRNGNFIIFILFFFCFLGYFFYISNLLYPLSSYFIGNSKWKMELWVDVFD